MAGRRAYVYAGYSIFVLGLVGGSAPVVLGKKFVGGWRDLLDFAATDSHLWIIRSGHAEDEQGREQPPLGVYDVRNPSRLRRVGSWGQTEGNVRRRSRANEERRPEVENIFLRDDLAFLTTTEGVVIFDASRPRHPRLIASVSLGQRGYTVTATATDAFLGTERGVYRIDVRDPEHLEVIGFFGTATSVLQLVSGAGLVFAVAGSSGLYVLDGRGSRELPGLSHFADFDYPQEVVYLDGRLYVADDRGGLAIVDAGDPASLVRFDVDFTASYASDVAIEGPYVNILDNRDFSDNAGTVYQPTGAAPRFRTGGIRTFDLSGPTSPGLIGLARAEWPISEGNLAASGGWVKTVVGFREVDLSNPAEPVVKSWQNEFGEADALRLRDGSAFALINDTLCVFKRRGRRFTQVGTLSIAEGADHIEVRGSIAFVVSDRALHLVDIRKPRHLALITTFALGMDAYAAGLDAGGRYLYVCGQDVDDDSASLQIIDLQDPTTPVRAASVELPCWDCKGLAVSETHVYVALWDHVCAVDVSNLTRPRVVAAEMLDDREDGPMRATYADGRLYVPCGESGLLVFELTATGA